MSFLSDALGGLVSGISGANYNAGQVGDFYNNAANKIVNASGSPAATTFVKEQNAALQPQFQQQDAELAAQEAAQGVTGSGQSKAAYGALGSGQAAALAGADAPLYSQALGAYDSTVQGGAGAQSTAYGQSLSDFYNALSSFTPGATPANNQTPTYGGSAYVPGPNYNPYGSSDQYVGSSDPNLAGYNP
jgi:hypothetical protein